MHLVKLIGSIHKTTTPEKLRAMHASGLSEARLHLSKIPPEQIDILATEAARLGMGIYLDTRGNKPTIVKITLADQTVTDKVPVEPGDQLLFCIEAGALTTEGTYKATLLLSYLPAILKTAQGKHLAIDDGNIILEINQVFEADDDVVGLSATVKSIDLEKVDAIYHEGISSFDIPIHSYTEALLTAYDKQCLDRVSRASKEAATDFVISFAENKEQILAAHEAARAAGLTRARVVPKLETVIGIEHAAEIADALMQLYGDDAELWIGRGDLTVALLKEGHPAVDKAEQYVMQVLKGRNLRIIVATNVANSLRHLRPGQRLSGPEKQQILNELGQGAAGFVMAAELYAGPEQKGEYAEEVIRAVREAVTPPSKLVINLVGYSGAGKSTVCDKLVREHSFSLYRPSDVIRAYAQAHSRALNGNNDYIACLKEMLDRDSDALVRPVLENDSTRICIDGLRSPAHLDHLKRAVNVYTVALTAPIEVRFERVHADASRSGHRALPSLAEFTADEAADRYNQDPDLPSVDAIIEMADDTIDTNGLDETQVLAKIDDLLRTKSLAV
jgi:cytidylate kinase